MTTLRRKNGKRIQITPQKPRLDKVAPGSLITWMDPKHPDDEPERAILLSHQGEGEDRTITLAQRAGSGNLYNWDLYRYKGRWAYGTSADRFSLLTVENVL